MKFIVFVMLLLLGALQVQLWVGSGGVRETQSIREQIALQEGVNGALRDKNKAIRAEIDDLKSGHDAIEERARTDLGMIRRGEVFYQVVESDDEGK